MVTQYPHTIVISTTTGSSKDGSGNWTAGTTSTLEKPGRFEPAKENATIVAADGSRIHYQGIVFLPLPQTTLATGVTVEVKKGAEVLLKNTIKQFSAGQLNARIWL